MLSAVLRSPIAMQRSIQIIRAFTALEKNKTDSSVAHGYVISALASEMYSNRKQIKLLARELEFVKQSLCEKTSEPQEQVISSEQSKIMRQIVKDKGKTKKGIADIWKKFKQTLA